MLHIMERWIDFADYDDELLDLGWECVEIEDDLTAHIIKECRCL